MFYDTYVSIQNLESRFWIIIKSQTCTDIITVKPLYFVGHLICEFCGSAKPWVLMWTKITTADVYICTN